MNRTIIIDNGIVCTECNTIQFDPETNTVYCYPSDGGEDGPGVALQYDTPEAAKKVRDAIADAYKRGEATYEVKP